jgi:hypothetical protein
MGTHIIDIVRDKECEETAFEKILDEKLDVRV